MTEEEIVDDRFVRACLAGDAPMVSKICDSHPDIVTKRVKGCWLAQDFGSEATGLHLAASKGHELCCRLLFYAGADIEARDGFGYTPLMQASDPDVLKLLLDLQANVHATQDLGSERWTTLHSCAYFDWNARAAQLLVSGGADLEAVTRDGHTPLMLALRAGNTKMALELVRLGAKNVDGKNGVPEETLLHVIARQCSEVSVGADIETLVVAGADLEAVDRMQRTPFITAALHNNAHACRKLIELGANVNARDAYGTTPLRAASEKETIGTISAWMIEQGAAVSDESLQTITEIFMSAAENGFEQAVCKLAKAGANLEERDEDRNTALLLAAKNGHTQAVRSLVKRGAKVDVRNSVGQGPYHLAAANGHLTTTTELIDAGADANTRDARGNTALHLAAMNGHTAWVGWEVNHGALVDARNNDGDSPLHLAAEHDQAETVRELARLGANVNVQNQLGNTALHLSARNGYLATIRADVECGANVNAGNKLGHSPLHLAAIHDQSETVDELVRLGADVKARDIRRNTALDIAAMNGFKTTVAALECNEAGIGDGFIGLRHLASLPAVERPPLLRRVFSDEIRPFMNKVMRCSAELSSKTSLFQLFKYPGFHVSTSLLTRLIQAGASVNERGIRGYTALHMAVFNQPLQLEAVKVLLDHGADLSATSDDGSTPLHSAVFAFHAPDPILGISARFESDPLQASIIRLLLARGAEPKAELRAFIADISTSPLNFWRLDIDQILKNAELAHELIKIGGEASKPTSVAIRFGGPPGAGKSTLTESLLVSRLQSVSRDECQEDKGASDVQQRTKGINCELFTDESSSRFAIFDLGGHGEFLATHQMFIGDGSVPVIDCVTVSALDDELEKHAMKWCSLFASRNQPTSTPWPLLLIATRADKASSEQQLAAFSAFHTIKQTFADHFCFPMDKPLFVDARKSWSELTVTLRRTLTELHKQLINSDESLPQPAICQNIEDHLPALRGEASAPVVTKDQFIDFMRPHIGLKDKELANLSMAALTSLFDKALQFLTGYATVLSFLQTRALNYVVIDPSWLLTNIVGRLMAEPPLFGPYVHYDNGYAKKADVIAALETEHLSGETAFEMVAGLGFCLEQKQLEKVLNPSKLRRSRALKHWCQDAAMVVNGGRRLKCKGTVAIASAFFSQLQVHFYHRYLTEYDEELPMWNGGIRLVAGKRTSAEALIEAHPGHKSIDIIVRGRSGSERACTDLLHELTDETLRKAVEISPGSQLEIVYLSGWELDHLSPTGLTSRPCVEYSAERVKDAIQHNHDVTDGKASCPESPFDLLLSPQDQEMYAQSPRDAPVAFRHAISDDNWRIVLLNLAKVVNNFDQCKSLATGLAVNDDEEDIVEQLRAANPHGRPPEIAYPIFTRWLKREDVRTTELRRAALHRVFLQELWRPNLCSLLDEQLRAIGCVSKSWAH